MLKAIENNFAIFIAMAFLVGLAIPDHAGRLNPYITYLLMGIMYLTILKIDLKELAKTASEPKHLIYLSLIILFAIPFYSYLATRLLYPSIIVPAIIFGSLPAAMASTSYTDLLGGNVHITLLLTIITSLAAPVTMPLIVSILAGVETQAGYTDMLLMLAKAIFVPFLLAILTKRAARRTIERTRDYYSIVNIGLLFLLIAGPVGANADVMLKDPLESAKVTIYSMALMGSFHFIGWFALWKRPMRDKVASATAIAYSNITLGVVFAYEFFPPEVVVGVVLFEIAWNLLPIPFQALVKKIEKDNQAMAAR